MATRIKTIQYSFPMYTTVVTDGVTTNLTQTTLYIPETVTSFVSVTADLGFQDIVTATGGTITRYDLGLRLGASAYTTIANTDDIVQSGENISGVLGPFDFTSLFTASWSGTSMTTDAQVFFDQTTGTTLGMRNVTVTLDITYEYDDTEATQVKTVLIPFESPQGGLPTTTNANLGSSQIPALTGGSGILPEAGVTIRDYYFIIEGNDASSSTADMTLTANIDSGTSSVFGVIESGLTTSRYGRWVHKPGSIPSTTAAHNFQLWTGTASRFFHITVTMVVTYQFTLASTTRTLNSILIPLNLNSPLGGPTSSDASRFQRELYITEPGTITTRHSAFRVNYNVSLPITGMQYRAGGQSYRIYSTYAGTMAGMFSVQQRMDSGSVQGAGVTLDRGPNNIQIDGYVTSTAVGTSPTNVTGYFIVNYESSVASQGIGAHAHTVKKVMLPANSLQTSLTRVTSITPTVPETNYRLISAGYILYLITSITTQSIGLDTQCLSGEGKGGGYYDIYSDGYQSDPELSFSMLWLQGREVMKRWPTDPGADRVDFKTSRDYRIFTADAAAVSLLSSYTYHAISFSVTGAITGSAGGTISINVYRSTDKELIYSTTRVGNGSYSFEWYDDTVAIYAEAYEDATHFGRSANVIAGTTSPDIAFGGGGSSVQVIARAFA